MRRIIYASRALHDFDDADLVGLLNRARTTNIEYGVTGMLVYASHSFVQLFEGEDSDVEVVWVRIRLDPRHTDLRVLADGPAPARLFADWSMGFEHPAQADLARFLPGYEPRADVPFLSAHIADSAVLDLMAHYATRGV